MKSLKSTHKLIKSSIFIASMLPLIWLILQAVTAGLGANPIEKVQHHTGDWALNFLLITLAVSPLQKTTGSAWLRGMRRMMGLYAFFYASLHLTAYVALDQFFSWDAIIEDVVKHKRVIVGFASYLLLLPLALTSSHRLIRRLGIERWRTLHRLVYAAAAGGVVHYLWLVKKDLRTPLIYASILAALLMYRVVLRLMAHRHETHLN